MTLVNRIEMPNIILKDKSNDKINESLLSMVVGSDFKEKKFDSLPLVKESRLLGKKKRKVKSVLEKSRDEFHSKSNFTLNDLQSSYNRSYTLKDSEAASKIASSNDKVRALLEHANEKQEGLTSKILSAGASYLGFGGVATTAALVGGTYVLNSFINSWKNAGNLVDPNMFYNTVGNLGGLSSLLDTVGPGLVNTIAKNTFDVPSLKMKYERSLIWAKNKIAN